MGFEPTTPTLARLCSTPELRPRRWRAMRRAGRCLSEPPTLCKPPLGLEAAAGLEAAGGRGYIAPMPATREELFAQMRDLGIETTTHTHPPVFTVEEAKRHCGHLPGGHCKSLFLKDKKGRLWLVVALDDQAIDLKALAKELGAARFSFGRAELLEQVLGVSPGAVTPFGLINDRERRVEVVLDAAMMELKLLNYHPLSNDATTAIRPQDLIDLIVSFGHRPRLLDFGALA